MDFVIKLLFKMNVKSLINYMYDLTLIQKYKQHDINKLALINKSYKNNKYEIHPINHAYE